MVFPPRPSSNNLYRKIFSTWIWRIAWEAHVKWVDYSQVPHLWLTLHGLPNPSLSFLIVTIPSGSPKSWEENTSWFKSSFHFLSNILNLTCFEKLRSNYCHLKYPENAFIFNYLRQQWPLKYLAQYNSKIYEVFCIILSYNTFLLHSSPPSNSSQVPTYFPSPPDPLLPHSPVRKE